MSKYISASNVYCFCSLVTSEKVKLSNIVDDNLPHYHKEVPPAIPVLYSYSDQKKARKERKKKFRLLPSLLLHLAEIDYIVEGLSTLEIFW